MIPLQKTPPRHILQFGHRFFRHDMYTVRDNERTHSHFISFVSLHHLFCTNEIIMSLTVL